MGNRNARLPALLVQHLRIKYQNMKRKSERSSQKGIKQPQQLKTGCKKLPCSGQLNAGLPGLLIVLLALLTLPTSGSARTLYRCEGRVQFRPCEQSFSNSTTRSARAELALPMKSSPTTERITPRAQYGANAFSKVIKQSYSRLSKNQGLWKGRVAGNGKVHLTLQIFRNGILESSRYMGNVLLNPTDRSISFHFKSYLPKGNDWTWKILTSARL